MPVDTTTIIRPFDAGNMTSVYTAQRWHTDNTLEKELWVLLKSYSEVKLRGYELLMVHGNKPSRKHKKWRVFRAYIRQAEVYWQAADKTNHRAGALLYYYCFLNLVKAFLTLNKKGFYNLDNQLHGLKHPLPVLELKIQKYQPNKQVFLQYYRSLQSVNDVKNIPDQIDIKNLFTFVTGMSSQVNETTASGMNSYPFMLALALDTKSLPNKAWYVLAFKGGIDWWDVKIQKWFKGFLDKYEKVTVTGPNNQLCKLFEIKGTNSQCYDFFQLKEKYVKTFKLGESVPNPELKIELDKCFTHKISPNYRLDDWAAYVNLPLPGESLFWNEELAIYTMMFCLSSFVRYHPDELDKLVEDELAWMIESFILTCPINFLKMITSHISDPNWIIQA